MVRNAILEQMFDASPPLDGAASLCEEIVANQDALREQEWR